MVTCTITPGRAAVRLNSGVRRVSEQSLFSLIGPDGLLDEPRLEELRETQGWTVDRICNELACLIASRFLADEMNFNRADAAMNWVRGYSLIVGAASQPEPCTEIYLAFDQGGSCIPVKRLTSIRWRRTPDLYSKRSWLAPFTHASNYSFKPRPLRGSANAVSCTTTPRRYAVRLNSGVRCARTLSDEEQRREQLLNRRRFRVAILLVDALVSFGR